MSICPDRLATQPAPEVYSSIICIICQNLLEDAQECTDCETNFCKICIDSWKRRQHTCPACRSTCEFKSPSRLLRGILNSTQITCSNKDKGCNTISAYESLSKHEQICTFNTLPCKYAQIGCAFKGNIEELSTHLESKCEFVSFRCKCGKDVKKRDANLHVRYWCAWRSVWCNGCEEQIQYRYAPNHGHFKCFFRNKGFSLFIYSLLIFIFVIFFL